MNWLCALSRMRTACSVTEFKISSAVGAARVGHSCVNAFVA